jgi:hypothetical protein
MQKGDTDFVGMLLFFYYYLCITAPTITEYSAEQLDTLFTRICDRQPSILRKIGAAIASVQWRFLGMLLFCIYLIFAIWGCTRVEIAINDSDLLMQRENAYTFINDYTMFYPNNERYVEIVVDGYVDYLDESVRRNLFELIDWAHVRCIYCIYYCL